MLPVKATITSKTIGRHTHMFGLIQFYVLNTDREAALVCYQSQEKMSIKVNMTSPLEVE